MKVRAHANMSQFGLERTEEARLPLQNRSKPRQVAYLALAFLALLAVLEMLASWRL